MSLNHAVEVVCPLCGAKHKRYIQDGRIYDRGKDAAKEQICPPKSACSKQSRTAKMRIGARDGVVVEESDADKIRSSIMKERWLELYRG